MRVLSSFMSTEHNCFLFFSEQSIELLQHSYCTLNLNTLAFLLLLPLITQLTPAGSRSIFSTTMWVSARNSSTPISSNILFDCQFHVFTCFLGHQCRTCCHFLCCCETEIRLAALPSWIALFTWCSSSGTEDNKWDNPVSLKWLLLLLFYNNNIFLKER